MTRPTDTGFAEILGPLLETLHARYTAVIPPCRVCGAALVCVDRPGQRAARYACQSRADAGERWQSTSLHYATSMWFQEYPADPAVIELLGYLAGDAEVRWGVRDAEHGDIWLLDQREAVDYAATCGGTVIHRIDLTGPVYTDPITTGATAPDGAAGDVEFTVVDPIGGGLGAMIVDLAARRDAAVAETVAGDLADAMAEVGGHHA